MMYKVNNFVHYDSEKKLKMFEYLLSDLKAANERENSFKSEIITLREEIVLKNEQLDSFHKLKAELAEISHLNSVLLKEKYDFELKCSNLQATVDSWNKASSKVTNLLNKQVPYQTKAYLGGDLDEAARIIEVERVEQDLKTIGSFTNAFKRNEDGQVLYTNRYVRSSKTNMEGEMKAMYESERIGSSEASCSNTKSNLPINKDKGKYIVIAEEPVKADAKTGTKAKASDKPILDSQRCVLKNLFLKMHLVLVTTRVSPLLVPKLMEMCFPG